MLGHVAPTRPDPLRGCMLWLLRSTNLDSWTVDQLKMMAFGGNGRGHLFFKQHGWSDGGKIDSKYTSRAAELYKQLLAKEVAKSAVVPAAPTNGEEVKPKVAPRPIQLPAAEAPPPAATPAAAKPSVAARKPMTLGVKKTNSAKGSGLGVKKMVNKVGALFLFLCMKVSEGMCL